MKKVLDATRDKITITGINDNQEKAVLNTNDLGYQLPGMGIKGEVDKAFQDITNNILKSAEPSTTIKSDHLTDPLEGVGGTDMKNVGKSEDVIEVSDPLKLTSETSVVENGFKTREPDMSSALSPEKNSHLGDNTKVVTGGINMMELKSNSTLAGNREFNEPKKDVTLPAGKSNFNNPELGDVESPINVDKDYQEAIQVADPAKLTVIDDSHKVNEDTIEPEEINVVDPENFE